MAAPRLDRLDRNYIINGNFDFWQRGISFTPSVNATNYTADRFSIAGGSNAGGALSVTRVAGPGGIHQYAARIACTTAQVAVNAAAILSFNHILEGTFWRDIYTDSGEFILKFKARSFQTGTFGLQLGNHNFTQIYQIPITFTASGVWQDFEFIVPIPTTGSWNIDTSAGLYVRLALVVGSSGESTSTYTWSSTATIRGITGQNNFLSSTSNYIEIAAYQLCKGAVEGKEFSMAGGDYAGELQLCRRYYEKLQGRVPLHADPSAGSTSSVAALWAFAVEKRASPVMSVGSGFPTNLRYYGGTSALRGVSSIAHNVTECTPNVGVFDVVLDAPAITAYTSALIASIATGSTNYVAADAEL